MLGTWAWLGASVPISMAIVIVAVRANALDRSGAVAAFVIGVACLGGGGLTVGAPLFAFFVSGSLLSRMGGPRSSDIRAVAAKSGPRDASQVIANGGAAALCAAAAGILAHVAPGVAERFTAAAVGALAVAAADTWATEIGALSAALPRSIADLREVRRGESGGVTLLGLLASLLGGAVVGACAAIFARPPHAAWWIASCAIVGFVGAALDSLLGATVQGAYICDACGAPCESAAHRCGARARLVRGYAWVDNDGVNAAATLAGALAAYLIALVS